MSLTVGEVCRALTDFAPEHWAEEWDNVGLLVGDPAGSVTQVLVPLEVTLGVLEEARTQGCEMIVAHHPVIFHPLRAVRADHPSSLLVHTAIRQGLHLYAAHSNLDQTPGGTNGVLAELLGLQETHILQPASSTGGGQLGATVHPDAEEACNVNSLENRAVQVGLGRVGTLLTPQTLEVLAREVQSRLSSPCCRLVGDPARIVQRVAVCGGSGASLILAAHRSGADVFVTGDIKYHDALQSQALGLALIDAGHYATEQPVVSRLARRLQEALPNLGVVETKGAGEPFSLV